MEDRTAQYRKGKLQQAFHEILGSSYYWDLVGKLEGLLSASRSPDVFHIPSELYLLQDEIIARLMDMEQAIRAGKKLKNEASIRGGTNAEQEYALGLLRNKALVYVTQSIADGMAWRLLNFDRPSLRVMSAPKKPRGSVDFPTTYPGMQDAAVKLMYQKGSRILFNDATHYLRLGDLTEFLPDGSIVIHELKNHGRTLKNAVKIAAQNPKAGVSKQMRNIVAAQTAINERRVRTQTEEVAFEDVNIPFSNNLEAVGNLIFEARKNSFARGKFGNYLEVYCTDVRATVSRSLNGEPQFWRRFDTTSTFDSSDIVVSLDNWDAWYEEEGDFTRNMTPYAVYPFSVSDCMGLISGALRLASRINLSELHRMFSANGWETTAFSWEQIGTEWQCSKNRRMGDETLNYASTMMAFTISRKGLNMALPLALLLRVATDYMRPEVLLKMVEHSYATTDWGLSKTFVPSILGEKDVWL